MDDSLEQPNADFSKTLISETGESLRKEDDEGQSSDDDEEGGLDWTKLPGSSTSRPVIPKRGEKEYEPKFAGIKGEGSGLQKHYLERARAAMFDALKATRSISSKSISYGVWYPQIARVHVTLARGTHFSNLGHSVPRPLLVQGYTDEPAAEKIHKRLELLPEEALYLVERGAMLCWKEHELFNGLPPVQSGLEDMDGSPMSVQQAFAEMIGKEDLSLEKYQVYSYLKRLGYVVTRTKAPTDVYPMPPPYPPLVKDSQSLSVTGRIYMVFRNVFLGFFRLLAPRFDWWKPLRINRWLGINMDHRSMFRSLRFIPHGHEITIKSQNPTTASPYEFFFNLYKPSTAFKKSSPPVPDFAVAVVNARTTPMPSLAELTALFDILPEVPPPLPRRKQQLTGTQKPTTENTNRPVFKKQQQNGSFSQRLVNIFSAPSDDSPPPRPHPFMALKTGKKTAVVAVVDAGTPSFFRFGQGAFELWPMFG